MAENDLFSEMNFPEIGEPEPQPEKSAEELRLEKLENELKEWQARFDTQQQTIQKLMSKPEPTVVNEPEFLASDLPDPVEKPEEFKAALKKRDEDMRRYITELSSHTLKQGLSEAEEKTALSRMWDDFKTSYNDIDEDLAETFARKECARIAAEGKDPKQYMLSNTKQFMEKVATDSRAYLSKYKTPSHRTDGIPGGDIHGNTKPKPNAPDFISQLKDFQRKDGFF